MADCKRKTFDTEWEAVTYIAEHPWPEPAPPVYPFICRVCKKFHISDKVSGTRRPRGRHAKPR
jgi:hypothetical protein